MELGKKSFCARPSPAAFFCNSHVHCRKHTNSKNTRFFPHMSVLRIYKIFPTQREYMCSRRLYLPISMNSYVAFPKPRNHVVRAKNSKRSVWLEPWQITKFAHSRGKVFGSHHEKSLSLLIVEAKMKHMMFYLNYDIIIPMNLATRIYA